MRKPRTLKKDSYIKAVNCKVTEQQYQDLLTIKAISGISISTMMRNNIAFLLAFYQPKK